VRRVGESLEGIISVVDRVVELVQDSTKATSSQRSAVQNARDNLSAIEQLNAQTLDLSAKGMNMVAELKNQASSLDEAVKSFRLA
jgi:methyl-accepting chemotaxis protein